MAFLLVVSPLVAVILINGFQEQLSCLASESNRHESREDLGLFWSNDPHTTLGGMIRSPGLGEVECWLPAIPGRYAGAVRDPSPVSSGRRPWITPETPNLP